MSKQYGLIKKGNVFGDSDSEDDNSSSLKKPQSFDQHALQKKQTQKIHEQALNEDASVFLYDEVFDDIQNKRNEKKKEKKTEEARKPKYISKLIETAEQRKKEYERRVERQVQKEREAEGEKFKDKESFVTSAYRQKLEEMKQAELLEKRQEYLESIGDVTKQADLSGFYRHLYSQKMEGEDKPDEAKTEVKKPQEPVQKKKNYRKRENSNDDDNDEGKSSEKVSKTEHLNSNLDADSDFSVESSSDEAETEKSIKKEKDEKEVMPPPDIPSQKTDVPQTVEQKIEIKEEQSEENAVEIKPEKPKINIWAKRTVGDVYIEAVKRYYERKALKESNKS